MSNNIEYQPIHQETPLPILAEIYSKYTSSIPRKQYTSLITTSPKKFLHLLKSNKNFNSLSQVAKSKIIEKTCEMIKSINPNEISIGLDILEEIIIYIPNEIFTNSFTYKKSLTENTYSYGFFACALEEEKDIKIKVLKIVSTYIDKIQSHLHFDFILELIHDEEDDVRFAAVDCLDVLIERIDTFSYENLSILIFALKEKHTKLRRRFMSLMSKMKFDLTQEQFKSVIKTLKDLRTFNEDRTYIYKSVKEFTKNNCKCLNEAYFEKSLQYNIHFLSPELDRENPFYIIEMIVFQEYVVFQEYQINMLLPKYIVNQLYYYEEKLPGIFDLGLSAYFLDLIQTSDKKDNVECSSKDIQNMQIDSGNGMNISNQFGMSKEDIDNNINDNLSVNDIVNNLFYSNTNQNTISVFNYEQIYHTIFLKVDSIYANITSIDESIQNDIQNILTIIYIINFQLSIEKEENESSTTKLTLIEYNKTLINILLQNNNNTTTLTYNQTFKQTINELLSQHDLTKKKMLSFCITHPENNEIYSDQNRGYKNFPFTLQIQLKLQNISFLKPNALSLIYHSISFSITNASQTFTHEILLTPSISHSNITIYDNKSISIKKKEHIYFPQSTSSKRTIHQYKFNIYLNDINLINSTCFNIET
jgi:hypothetical protein